MKNILMRECVSEFIGTFVLIFIGVGAVAAMVTAEISMTFWELAIVWGLAVTIAIYISGFVSGAHINPAVTIGLAVWAGFSWKKVGPYIVAQILGAFSAASVVYVLYHDSIKLFEQSQGIVRGSEAGIGSAGIFSTFPKEYLSLFDAFLVEMSITALLFLVILAVTDAKNEGAPQAGLPALAIGLTVAVCGLAFGPLTGFAMNPARDFGPRLFILLAGWNSDALGPHLYGLIVPIFAPIVGGILGGAIYKKLLASYFPLAKATILEPENADVSKQEM